MSGLGGPAGNGYRDARCGARLLPGVLPRDGGARAGLIRKALEMPIIIEFLPSGDVAEWLKAAVC